MSGPDGARPHEISLAVWDLPSPVVTGSRARVKVGVSCSAGCNLAGTRIDVLTDTDAIVGSALAGATSWPSTEALYWTELELAAPEAEGDYSWYVCAAAHGPAHAGATSVVRFIAVRPPEHRVAVEVVERGSGAPLAEVELRIGVFRATTNEAGLAQIDVPAGMYDVAAWKLGYDLASSAVQVDRDTTIRLDVVPAEEPEQPYWM